MTHKIDWSKLAECCGYSEAELLQALTDIGSRCYPSRFAEIFNGHRGATKIISQGAVKLALRELAQSGPDDTLESREHKRYEVAGIFCPLVGEILRVFKKTEQGTVDKEDIALILAKFPCCDLDRLKAWSGLTHLQFGLALRRDGCAAPSPGRIHEWSKGKRQLPAWLRVAAARLALCQTDRDPDVMEDIFGVWAPELASTVRGENVDTASIKQLLGGMLPFYANKAVLSYLS